MSSVRTVKTVTVSAKTERNPVFSRVFDVVVFGAGYAGFAAAMRLSGAGRSVLLTDLRGDMLWESGRAFQNRTGAWTPGFSLISDSLLRITGITDEWFDGASAEIVANELARDARLPALYYAAPVGVERDGERLAAVILATKCGLRRVAARQWIDATESGSVASILQPGLRARKPASLTAAVALQRVRWPGSETAELRVPELSGCSIAWEPSCWSTERVLRITMPGDDPGFLRTVVPAMKVLRFRLGKQYNDAFVSHVSFEPYPIYAGSLAPADSAPNIALASPALAARAVRTIVDRFELGLAAAAELVDKPSCESGARFLRRPHQRPRAARETAADVVVAGLGTGGALAAIAAAREGASVLAFDPLSFPGGVGTGAGIPIYYYGCPGGLQDEVDGRVRELTPLFTSRASWPLGFHPDVKRIVLDELLRAEGVQAIHGAIASAVENSGGRIKSALAATPVGPLRIRGREWIDATGDGDLCALAGSRFRLGREGDGNLNTFTQSCGCFGYDGGRLVDFITNPDSGNVDPTDPEDLTRARIEGIHAMSRQTFNSTNRLTYVAPLLGIRQGRLISARYKLTLDDLVERRRFMDSVGYTGGHYDSHLRDYEFESDLSFVYARAAGLGTARTACQIPYRMLLPRKLENVWIACRAAGVSEEASNAFRMQRDIQRIGEVCGVAASIAARRRVGSGSVPLAAIRERLRASGALSLPASGDTSFGRAVFCDAFAGAEDTPANDARWLAKALKKPGWGKELWRIYRAPPRSTRTILRKCIRSVDTAVRWRAALLLAALGDPAAEVRLLRSIARMETNPEAEHGATLPRWRIALHLLRSCGTSRSSAVLHRLTSQTNLPDEALIGIALACESLGRPGRLRPHDRCVLRKTVERLARRSPETGNAIHSWHTDYALARARRALGMARDGTAAAYLSNPRAIVRRAFAVVLKSRLAAGAG